MSYLVMQLIRGTSQVIKQVNYNLWGVRVSNIQILILATACLLMVMPQLIIKKTKNGPGHAGCFVDPDVSFRIGRNQH